MEVVVIFPEAFFIFLRIAYFISQNLLIDWRRSMFFNIKDSHILRIADINCLYTIVYFVLCNEMLKSLLSYIIWKFITLDYVYSQAID